VRKETLMHFTDDSLLPENQAPLIITAVPYGPMWIPEDCKRCFQLNGLPKTSKKLRKTLQMQGFSAFAVR
jgi:hypothetical protein